jgi:hypothetical protein
MSWYLETMTNEAALPVRLTPNWLITDSMECVAKRVPTDGSDRHGIRPHSEESARDSRIIAAAAR